jgi:hypothetical protein
MKLLIVASPKTGNVWLERLLAHIYKLPIVDLSGVSEIPPHVSEKHFITHQHYLPTQELLEWGEKEGIHFITLTRHPGDVFVSVYHYVNNFAPLWKEKGWLGTDPSHVMIGEEIDSPKSLEYMKTKFRFSNLGKSIAWLQSGKALPVRYEDLHTTPLETLEKLTSQLEPVDVKRIEQAIEAADIRKMRQESTMMQAHCRKGSVGNWQEELNEAHFEVMQKYWADQMVQLGYKLEAL